MLAAAETLAVDVADARALKARAAGGDKEALRAAARQFESLMVTQMLKTLRETRFSEEDDPMTSGEGYKLYRDLLDQQWAARMANGRGLGFADMMIKHLERQAGMPAEAVNGGKPLPTPAFMPDRVLPAGGEGATSTAPARAGGREEASQPPVQDTRGKTAPASAAGRKQAFLESMLPHAEAAEAATGVPARFILAQAALESGWGAREIKGAEGQSSFNLFGIKAGRGWAGESVEATTTEYRQGLAMKQTRSFRAYADYGAAFTDYANLLRNRYGEALRAGEDAGAFALGLAEGGYATDPAYAGKLKAVIASVAMAGV
jgi:flagellar protein FlgJ